MIDWLVARLRGAAVRLRAHIVPDLAALWRQWSTWLLAIGTGFVTFVQAFPREALDLWNSLPADLRGRLPDRVAFAVTASIVVLAFASKHVAQRHDR